MRKVNIVCLCAALIVLAGSASCVKKEMTPATEIAYEGELIGNETVTYPSTARTLEICMKVKSCMGLNEYSYPLPKIRGMRGGNAVDCGGTLKRGCYRADGWIIVPEGEEIDIIAHECVHHWLNMHTGDLDAEHESGLFLACGGSFTLDGDAE
jgi:hypothetical protein